MPEFDWDKQEDAPAKGFSWDDQEDIDKPSGLSSAIRHGLQGLTGSFSDELVGGGEALGRAAGIEGAGGPMSEMGLAEGGPTLDWDILSSAYKKARDHEREALKKDSKYNPGTSGVAEVAGSLASPLNKLGNGLSLAKRSAVLGGLTSAGSSEADNLKDLAIDTGIGTGTGLAMGKVLDVASPYVERGVERASEGARDMAESLGARALGAERGTIKKLGFDKVKAAAGQALDEGALPIFGDTEDLMAKNAAVKKRGGEMMGQAYKAIDDAGASTFNPLDVATKMDENLGGFWRTPLNKGETGQFENTLETILQRGDKNIPLSEAQKLKELLGDAANWKNNVVVTPKEQMARDAYRLVNTSIDDALESGASAVNSAGLKETLAKGKELYGNAKTSEVLLGNKLAREQGNKLFGLTDSIIGAGSLGYGGATGDWKSAAVPLLAKKGLEKYGPRLGAQGMNKISEALMKSPTLSSLAQKFPEAFGALSSKITDKIAPSFKDNDAHKAGFDKDAVIQKVQGTKYAQVLQDAAKRGEQSFGATHFILQSTDPQYREALDKENKVEP